MEETATKNTTRVSFTVYTRGQSEIEMYGGQRFNKQKKFIE